MPPSTMNDPAFDPSSAFMFGEDDEQFHAAMQRGLSPFSQNPGINNGLQPYYAMSATSDGDTPPSVISNPSLPQMMYTQPGEPSPLDPSWSEQMQMPMPMQALPQSRAQAAGAMSRSGGSISQFGQITPPEETSSVEPAGRHDSVDAKEQATTSAKSERARNAANSRHSKAKRAKKESFSGRMESPSDGDDKREKYREKNRLAAAKCRAKKKNNTEDLEEAARIAGYQNTRLKQEARELRDEFSELRSLALMHDKTQGCTCSDMHAYNQNKAQEQVMAVRTAGHASDCIKRGSPSQDSIDSPVQSPVFGEDFSRSHSFSGGRPSFQKGHTARAHSLAGPGMSSSNSMMQHLASPQGDGSQFAFNTQQDMAALDRIIEGNQANAQYGSYMQPHQDQEMGFQ
ncbi:unnamed protein product [Zymoseptoria tritici ST99CH_3D1]|uniref:BZIP domain-containing protein n=3 Tax=Zymoseptoria tritici TaxID=1047171 RepID=A0A1X7RKV6_ZYMT9|nr:unnamed protein product [Zymoseptoria tritici ST99CH_3D7]SMR46362.1 unnamed protein product [Zymoseptoria tritici ST99CH_1E4]SMR47613.1 unnamed protein product [Zymoseptoria tritici ST99CH_3D1]